MDIAKLNVDYLMRVIKVRIIVLIVHANVELNLFALMMTVIGVI